MTCKQPCPVCEEKRRILDESQEEALLREYVAALPEHLRTDAATLSDRLAQCSSCPHRRQSLCALCGCFVQARAAKADRHCPDPSQPRW